MKDNKKKKLAFDQQKIGSYKHNMMQTFGQ